MIPPRMMKKRPARAARVAPGQAQTFFEEPLYALLESSEGAGTLLDPAWTHVNAIGYFDESQRLLQVPLTLARYPTLIYFPAAVLTRYLGKVDWIEVIDGRRCLRISGQRFERAGKSFTDRYGARQIGAPTDEWDEVFEKVDDVEPAQP